MFSKERKDELVQLLSLHIHGSIERSFDMDAWADELSEGILSEEEFQYLRKNTKITVTAEVDGDKDNV